MSLTKEITIAGLVLSVSVPFAEGHVMTAAEAKQLNQVRAENIRNNTAAAVKKLATDPEAKVPEYTAEAVAAATELVAKYDTEYDFTLGGGAVRRVTDPLERECLAIARAHLTAKIKAAGKNVKDMDKEKLEAKIEEIAKNEAVVKMAKARLKDKEKLSDALASAMSDEA